MMNRMAWVGIPRKYYFSQITVGAIYSFLKITGCDGSNEALLHPSQANVTYALAVSDWARYQRS
jgi:hypothetical protein